MKVELVLNIEENNESAVLEKVLEITKHINQIGLKIDKLLMLEKYDISYLMSRLNTMEALAASILKSSFNNPRSADLLSLV
jgi:hypothetical protein